MKHTFKKSLSIILAAVMLFCSAPIMSFVGLELQDVLNWFASTKANAASDELLISTSPSKIRYSFDSEGNLYLNGIKKSSFTFDVNFSTESSETIKLYYVITAPEAFSGEDLEYFNTGRSVSKSSPYTHTVKLNVSKPLALKDSKIEIKAYKSGTLGDDANLIASASVKVEKFTFSNTELSEIKKSASVQIKPEIKELTCNYGTISDNEIKFTATIYNNIPSQYHIYEEYIKSSSDFDLKLDSISGREWDYCKKIKLDSMKNVVIKPGESHTINGTLILEESRPDISDIIKKSETKFGVEFEGTCGGEDVWNYNDCIITIVNEGYNFPINGNDSLVNIKWPSNAINLDGLANLGLSLAECQNIADIVLVELAMFTLPPKSLEEKISSKILNKVFKCNIHLGVITNEMKIVFPVTIDGKDMEIDIICSTTQFSWDGTPFGSFSEIKYKAYTLEGLFNKRKFHSEGTAGMFSAANAKEFFVSAHDFAISKISSAGASFVKTEDGFAEIIFRTIPQLILSKKGQAGALDNAAIDLYIKGVDKLLKIDCPVDVFIYDTVGNLCASVENNEVTLESDKFDLRINGATKELYFYGNEYKIVTKATANGTMDVTVEEVGYINGTMHKYEMNDAPLSIGKEYTLNINGEMEDPLNYCLISNNGDRINCDEIAEDTESFESGVCGENLTWTLNKNTGNLVISGTGEMRDYEPYGDWTGFKGISSPWYKLFSEIKTVTISPGVTSIGDYAFAHCENLINIRISNTVKSIGGYAYAWCYKLTDIALPESVKKTEDHIFRFCSKLTSVTLPVGVSMEGDLLLDCNSVKNIYYLGDIEDWCKAGRQYYVLLDDVENLYLNGVLATDIIIPDSITYIDDLTFSGCNNVTRVSIPDSVTTIGSRAFSECENLESVKFGAFVTEIKNGAFSSCKNLKTLTLPKGINKIGAAAFSGCSNLTSVILPDSITSIGAYAFEGCQELESITIPENVKYIGNKAFGECFLSKVYFNAINCEKTESPFEDSFIEYVSIGNKVSQIPSYAFHDCHSVKNIVIPESVIKICEYAFWYCSDLSSVSIPSKLKEIERKAFVNCINLKTINYNASNAAIAEEAFEGCTSITEVNIGSDVTIPRNLFQQFTNVTYITFPMKIKFVGLAFAGCGYITDFYYPGSQEDWFKTLLGEDYKDRHYDDTEEDLFYTILWTYGIKESTNIHFNSGKPSNSFLKKPSSTIINYGDGIILHIDKTKIPEGGYVDWTASNNNFSYSENSETCEVRSEKSGNTIFTATIYDAEGNLVSTAEQTMTSKAGFFQKIIAFFKGIFGLNKTIPNVFKF